MNVLINYLKLHRQKICFGIFVISFLFTGSYITSWELLKALVSFTISMVSFVLGTLWIYKE